VTNTARGATVAAARSIWLCIPHNTAPMLQTPPPTNDRSNGTTALAAILTDNEERVTYLAQSGVAHHQHVNVRSHFEDLRTVRTHIIICCCGGPAATPRPCLRGRPTEQPQQKAGLHQLVAVDRGAQAVHQQREGVIRQSQGSNGSQLLRRKRRFSSHPAAAAMPRSLSEAPCGLRRCCVGVTIQYYDISVGFNSSCIVGSRRISLHRPASSRQLTTVAAALQAHQ
jgi:hypothetical protein